MRLYHWSPMHEADGRDDAIHESVALHDVGRQWTGVPLSSQAPKPGAGLVVVLDIPHDIVEPFEVAPGRYLVPASVIRPYPAVPTRSEP